VFPGACSGWVSSIARGPALRIHRRACKASAAQSRSSDDDCRWPTKRRRTPLTLSPEPLFLYLIVLPVKARNLSGQGTDAAVRKVAAQHYLPLTGEEKTSAVRSI